jgi:hypothetical protein
MFYNKKKSFHDLELFHVTNYEIEEYGDELPHGMIYYQVRGKIRGFVWDSTICEEDDADLFFENFYNFVYDLQELMKDMLSVYENL